MPCAAKPASTASTSFFADGSRLAVGSSRNKIPGRTAHARASARRCCWPPDKARAGRSRRSASPTRCKACAARSLRWGRGTRASHNAMSRLCQTDKRNTNGFWNTMTCLAASSTSRLPPCASMPCNKRSKVVLPEPLAPTSAMKSPRFTLSVTWFKARTAPKRTEASRNLSKACTLESLIARPPTPSPARAEAGRCRR